MSSDHLRIEDRTEEGSLAGSESLRPLPATRGFTSDERSELGDWILWEILWIRERVKELNGNLGGYWMSSNTHSSIYSKVPLSCIELVI